VKSKTLNLIHTPHIRSICPLSATMPDIKSPPLLSQGDQSSKCDADTSVPKFRCAPSCYNVTRFL